MPKIHTVPWIWGPPFAGKSTLAQWLDKENYKVFETDAEREKHPKWRKELKRAWRKGHKLHQEWKAIDREHRRNMELAMMAGFVVLDHMPPPTGYRGFLLFPGTDQIAQRVVKWTREQDDPTSRVEAVIHYLLAHLCEHNMPSTEMGDTDVAQSFIRRICTDECKWEKTRNGQE